MQFVTLGNRAELEAGVEYRSECSNGVDSWNEGRCCDMILQAGSAVITPSERDGALPLVVIQSCPVVTRSSNADF